MSPVQLRFSDERLILDPTGAVFWPSKRILVVSDLHLEKASAAAMRGMLLPPFDTRATLEKLHRLILLYRPNKIISLGDSFHDNNGIERMSDSDRMHLTLMATETPFIWITGNHDSAPLDLPGTSAFELQEEPFVFRHQADLQLGVHSGEISGHYHPKATIATKAQRVSRPCFVTDTARLMLPSFGSYTGGLDIRDPAIAALFPNGLRVLLLGQKDLFSFCLGTFLLE